MKVDWSDDDDAMTDEEAAYAAERLADAMRRAGVRTLGELAQLAWTKGARTVDELLRLPDDAG
jgi:hypothetical protein